MVKDVLAIGRLVSAVVNYYFIHARVVLSSAAQKAAKSSKFDLTSYVSQQL